MNLSDMVEPTDPAERAAAIRICRANAHLNIETGEPLPEPRSAEQWRTLKDDLPARKWLWMWNYGIDEWRTPSANVEQK